MLRLDHFEDLRYALTEYKKRKQYAHAFVANYLYENLLPKDNSPRNYYYVFKTQSSGSNIGSKIKSVITPFFGNHVVDVEGFINEIMPCLAKNRIKHVSLETKNSELKNKMYHDEGWHYIFYNNSFNKYFNTISTDCMNYILKETKTPLLDGYFRLKSVSELLITRKERFSNLIPSSYLYQ